MTFEQGAIIVISTLGGVVSFLFSVMMSTMKARLKAMDAEISHQQVEIEECRQDRENIWRRMRDMPNPQYCPTTNCPMKAGGSIQMTFSTLPENQKPNPS